MSEMEVCDDYIETFTGGKFWFGDLMPQSDIRIEDIAHALSIEPRFGGHTSEPYSVAEHCCHVFDLYVAYGADAQPGPLGALLHDAHEAYTKDVMKPLRRTPGMEGYNDLAKRVQAEIEKRFALKGLFDTQRARIKSFDMAMLKREAEEFMHTKGRDWTWPDGLPVVSRTPSLWPWKRAETEFMARYYSCND